MKIFLALNAKRICAVLAAVCLVLAAFAVSSGLQKHITTFLPTPEENKYETRSRLLTEAIDVLGVCSAEDAADIWASGLKMRSAAMQYAVMSGELKEDYVKQLETNAPNWATGVSSPWVKSYKIEKIKTSDSQHRTFELSFSLATSTGPAGTYHATLIVAPDKNFWRIVSIKAAPELYVYMGFEP